MKLQELKQKYEELGREIKKLKTPETVEVELIQFPKKLKLLDPDKQMPWQEAMDYAESIDMRLATLPELQMIAASTDQFNHLGWCWSSSTLSFNTTNAWDVYLGNGNTNTNYKTNGKSVLCVKESSNENG